MASELWQRIGAARKHSRMTLQQLADRVGVTRQSVHAWESPDPERRNTPRVDVLRAIARVTGVPVGWLTDDGARVEDLIRSEGASEGEGGGGDVPMRMSYVVVSRLQPPSRPRVATLSDADGGKLAFKRSWIEYRNLDPSTLYSHQVDTDDFARNYCIRRGDTLLVDTADTGPREGWWIVGEGLVLARIDVALSGEMTLRAPEPSPLPGDLPIVGRVVVHSREL